ncbi:hypothetical protein CDAR_259801 [Caerostris darwini]|uniref:Uncharacterized protein n=1 Tax=Caerostris darwini TaxID=1538125 RepID=A0AAV4VQ08_9ARAC|nr:hypothetical protein CDAR_259801 [Caerostris darwini]
MEIRVSTVESSCRMWKIQGLAYVTVEYGRLTIYSNLNWMNGNPGLHCRIIMSNVENTRISLFDCRIRSIDHPVQSYFTEKKSVEILQKWSLLHRLQCFGHIELPLKLVETIASR